MTFYLDKTLQAFFNAKKSLFDQLMALRGEVYRQLEGRTTQRVLIGSTYYFIKQHTGVGIREILKNLCQGKLPVISAKNEWLAIAKLKQIGIKVPAVLGFGERGFNPANKESFILLAEITNSESLEDITANWQKIAPDFKQKRAYIAEVARIARVMHEHGINHRDFYLCHFLSQNQQTELCLIDLHRAQIRSHTPKRWRIKDLAGLYFSSRGIGLSKRDELRFLRAYCNRPLAVELKAQKGFWQEVKNRGEKLYREQN